MRDDAMLFDPLRSLELTPELGRPLGGARIRRNDGDTARLIDTTMYYAPRSGGVKRYLLAKQGWMASNRPRVEHTLVVPGAEDRAPRRGIATVASARLPFGRGYRWPASKKAWADRIEALSPDVIEAGDPYVPGVAAIEAGQRLGVPIIGVCHSDPAILAALHFGAWAEKPVRKRLERLYRRFDRVVAPSRYIAERLADAGVERVVLQHWGVDVDTFEPSGRNPAALRERLGLDARHKLLVFAGRPAKEKRVDVLVEAAERLGPDYRLLLIGAGENCVPGSNTIVMPYEKNATKLAAMVASCDLFVHANDREMFGLIVLEAMACGLPVVGVRGGGVAELIDDEVGALAEQPTGADLAAVIEAVLGGDYRAMGDAARRRAVARFVWDRTFENLSRVYGEVSGHAAFTCERPIAPLN